VHLSYLVCSVVVWWWPNYGRNMSPWCDQYYSCHLRNVVLQTVHTILFTVTQRDGLYQICRQSALAGGPKIFVTGGPRPLSAPLTVQTSVKGCVVRLNLSIRLRCTPPMFLLYARWLPTSQTDMLATFSGCDTESSRHYLKLVCIYQTLRRHLQEHYWFDFQSRGRR
jgi:hypothetical protein